LTFIQRIFPIVKSN